MKKIRLLTLLVLGMLVGSAYAQSRVSGVVKSSDDGQPLAGVTVRVKGTNLGAVTGPDGSYTINSAPASATLEFMYAGMRNQSVAVGGKSTLNVTMAPDALQAEGVTVTALGGTKQDRKLGYATTTVKGDELARTNAISPVNALQGKVAGLSIQTSGSSGLTGAPQVTLRGAKSLTKNNSPIYVIDGIVMENPTALGENASVGGTGSTMYGNQLKNLNMDDYESVTVLKGAAATSLYGSRGANGAIVLTSKSGKARKGIGVDVKYSHEFSQTYAPPLALQNVFGAGSPGQGYDGDFLPGKLYGYEGYTSQSWGPQMNGQPSQQFYKLWPDNYNPTEPFVAHPDNWKAFFDTGQSDNVSVSLTGGSEKATYRISYGYVKTKGSLPNNSFSRHSIDLNTHGTLNDVFSVDFNLKYGNSNTMNAQNMSAYGGNNFVMNTTYYLERNMDLRWYRDNFIKPGGTWERIPTNNDGALGNLQGIMNNIIDKNQSHKEQTVIAYAQLNAKLTNWLDASASISYNMYVDNNENKNYGSGKFRAGGEYYVSGSNSSNYNSLVQLHSNNSFVDDNLTLDIRVIYEMYGNAMGGSFSKSTRGGLITPGLFTFANSKEPIRTDEMSAGLNYRNSMVMGVGGVANISWKDQINLEVTARNDWNSSLLYPSYINGANNYSIFYPSANASWVFSDTFGINPDVLSMGRLRASIAQVGSGTGAYQTAAGTGGFNVGNATGPTNNTFYTASANNGTLANLDLKPEIQQTIEFGTDLRFLNGAIGIDVAYYKTNTFNQILSLAGVTESGVSNRLINAGNIQNQGWEIGLDFRPIQTNKVRWEIGVNWARNRGKVKELHPDIKQYAFNSVDAGAIPGIYAFEGGAFGQIVSGPSYGYGSSKPTVQYKNPNDPNDPRNGMDMIKYAGVVKENEYNSSQIFRWVQGGDIKDYYNKEHPYDVLGNIEADFNFGFNTSLSYAGFDLFVQIDGRVGGQMIAPDVRYARNSGTVESTLYGRSAEYGGVERINYKGEKVMNGLVMNGVFGENQANKNVVKSLRTGQDVSLNGMTMQEAIDAGHIRAPLASIVHQYNSGFNSSPLDRVVHDMTYISLREVSLGYNFPEKWIKTVGLQSARLSFTARNICYLFNRMPDHMNPESLSSNNPLTPVSYGGVPYARNFNLAVQLRF